MTQTTNTVTFETKETLVSHICEITGIPFNEEYDHLSEPQTLENHPTYNTVVFLYYGEQPGQHAHDVCYKYNRKLINSPRYPLNFVYEDELDSIDVLREFINERCALDLTKEEMPDLGHQLKEFLFEHSPLGEIEIKLDNYAVKFNCKIKLFPRKVDAKYLINHIATRVDGLVVWSIDREIADGSDFVWRTLRSKIAEDNYGHDNQLNEYEQETPQTEDDSHDLRTDTDDSRRTGDGLSDLTALDAE